MELRHIRYFLVVAEEKNFTRAAQRLGISQPPLSMQIKDLEEEIGAELFHRSPSGVELTEVGYAFKNAVQLIPNRVLEAVQLAQSVANGEVGQLRLGFTGTSILNPLIPASIRAFQHSYPNIDLKLEEANSLRLIKALLEDQLDVAIIRAPESTPDALNVQNLLDEPLIMAIPVQLPLSIENQTAPLNILKNYDFILSPRTVSAGLYDAIINACRQAGFEPKIGQNAPQIASILALISANLGVSLVPESTRQLGIAGIQYISIDAPTPFISLAIAYKKKNPSQTAINFASVLNSICREAIKP